MIRRIVRIRAEDSPNVRLALAQIAAGREPTHETLVPGVLTYREYVKRRKLWDPVRQCIGLDAQFYKGGEVLLFPPIKLNEAEELARNLHGKRREAKALGVDTGEGEANTAWSVVDELGLIELLSYKTPDTSVIPGQTLALMKRYNLEPEQVCFDRGGGGYEHANTLRSQGFDVTTVAFGEGVNLPPREGLRLKEELIEAFEERLTYVNRRAQMFGEMSTLVSRGWGIPAEYVELRRQLALLPKLYDGEGRLRMLPKNRRTATSKEKTLVELLGCSPDEADAVALGVHRMLHEEPVAVAG